MNKDNHSEVKLLNKDVKVTDKDVWEFNAWIKGKKITPKLMKEFDSESDYEDFMLDYDENATYSVVQFPLDQPGVYQKDSEQYNYLSGLDQGVYDQVITNLAKNGLKLEYDSLNDEFKVYSDGECKDGKCDLGNTKLECGKYDKSSDIYKALSSLTDAGYEKVLSDLANEGKVLNYDSIADEFNVTEKVKTQSHKFDILEPGTYKKGTKEYRYLNNFEDYDWTDYQELMSEQGLTVGYDNLQDAFIVEDLDADTFSEEGPELGENHYIVVKLTSNKGAEFFYYDIISELHPWFKKLSKAKVGSLTYLGDWIVEKLTDDLPMAEAYGRFNTEFANAKYDTGTFSEDQEREKVSEADLKKAQEEGVVQKKPNGKWGIISIEAGEWWIPDYDTKENAEAALRAYHANKGFSEKEIDSVTVETTNPDQLVKILEAIKSHGNPGHSFEIAIDYKDERQETFGWDGDGADRIDEITVTKSNEESKSFAKEEFDTDIAKAVMALIFYDNYEWVKELSTANFDDLVEILQDAITETFPNDKNLYSKAASLVNRLTRIADGNIRSF